MINGEEVIDFHGHQSPWDFLGAFDDAPTMLGAMDACGIDRACLFNIWHIDAHIGHEELAKFVSRHPSRFIGFAYASALSDNMVEETRRVLDQHKFAAIKTYPPSGNIPINDPRWDQLYDLANERELALITHTGMEPAAEPKYLADVAPRFPRVKFVAGHSGNIASQRRQAIEVAKQYPNIYLETCSSFRTPGVIEQLVKEARSDRILFGSDIPVMDPRCQIGKIITADISDDDKRLILGQNAKRLLNLADS